MDTIGLDLHKRETQVCILEEDGGIVERRISTTRHRFTAVLGSRPPSGASPGSFRSRGNCGRSGLRSNVCHAIQAS